MIILGRTPFEVSSTKCSKRNQKIAAVLLYSVTVLIANTTTPNAHDMETLPISLALCSVLCPTEGK